VSHEELTRAKEFTKGRLRLELETTSGVAFWLTYQQLLLGAIKTIDEELALVDAVSAEDVQRVARQGLSGPLQMAVGGPFPRDSAFRLAIGAWRRLGRLGGVPREHGARLHRRHLLVDVESAHWPDPEPGLAVDPVPADGSEE